MSCKACSTTGSLPQKHPFTSVCSVRHSRHLHVALDADVCLLLYLCGKGRTYPLWWHMGVVATLTYAHTDSSTAVATLYAFRTVQSISSQTTQPWTFRQSDDVNKDTKA